LIDNRFNYLHIPPKPSIWRGKYRKTKSNFFDASGTRNTGIIVAENDHIVFVDDLSALTDGWINYHRVAAAQKIILCGAYDKVSNITIEKNQIKSYIKKNHDTRMQYQLDDKNIHIHGGWIFGQNVSFPIEYLIKVNGYDEFLARKGCEDCNLGVRLENAGYKDLMFYNKNCLIIEDELLHYTGENTVDELYCKRHWKSDLIKNENANTNIRESINKIEIDHLYVQKQYLTINNDCDLIKDRELYRTNKTFKSIEHINFTDYDGEPIENI
jgi:hypothetical protein